MKNGYVFITDLAWFETTSLKNPVAFPDQKLESFAPEFYSLNYDTKLLAAKPASKAERESPFYNDYLDAFGTADESALTKAVSCKTARNIFLNGLTQNHFLQIAPYIKDTVEVLYFFKCPQIYDLSALATFPNLKGVLIYWNTSLEKLWDMTNNRQLQTISVTAITKLRNVEMLSNSTVEYVNIDSSDNSGHKKKIRFDPKLFDHMPQLKHLSLVYSDYQIDY